MASGVVAIGLFGATWIAGVVGRIGASLGNERVERVGVISRVLLDAGGAAPCTPFQDPSALVEMGDDGAEAFPVPQRRVADARLPGVGGLWVAMIWARAAGQFLRRDL